MNRSLLLAVALFATAGVANADGGTVHFGGRITDPGCAASLTLAQQQLQLNDCPRSAQGATVSVALLDTGRIVDLGTDTNAPGLHTLIAPSHQNGRLFSTHYQLRDREPVGSGYMVMINYL